MKKLFNVLIAFAVLAAGLVCFSSCSPTAGLEEVSFEEIANAKMSGTYTCYKSVYVRDSDGEVISSSKETTEKVSYITVKTTAATVALLCDLSGHDGVVYANDKFTKVTIYDYTIDSETKVKLNEICYKYVKE